jgi:hypothetical protein
LYVFFKKSGTDGVPYGTTAVPYDVGFVTNTIKKRKEKNIKNE